MSKILRQCLPLLLILTYVGLGMAQVTRASITFDEGPHLAIGYATLRTGDFRLQPIHIHPPLANVLAAAPLLLQSDLPDPRAVDGWEINSLSAITDAVVWRYPEPARIATAGRVPILWLGVLLGTLIYRWAKDLGGWRAGLLALTLYTFDPNCIAHGALITTDMAAVFFTVATLYATMGYQGSGGSDRSAVVGIGRLLMIGLLLGLAQLTKVSALLLVPVVGLLVLVQVVLQQTAHVKWQNPRIRESGIRHPVSCIRYSVSGIRYSVFGIRYSVSGILPHVFRSWAIVFGVAAIMIWAGYDFEIVPVPGFPFSIPAGTHLRIFQSLQEHYELGHPTFLMGRVSTHGWWWYFPAAFVLKTPLPVLILVVWAMARCALRVFTFERLNVGAFYVLRQIPGMLSLVLFPALYAASSLFSSVNIGYRHLLPLLPFLYIGIGVCGVGSREYGVERKDHVSRTTYHALRFTFYVLLTWLIINTITLAPHFMTFFNELAGGPGNGYRYLVDSNLDWGQNLWDLRQWMVKHGEGHVSYAHYSPARPDVYGIDADFLPPDPRAIAFVPWNPAPGLYAIGATVLQGPYMPDINTYAWFRAREPLARLGNALWLYQVPLREIPAWAVICAGIPFSPETVGQRLGLDDLRIVQVDCARAFVYPAGQRPGVLIAQPDVNPPPPAQVDVVLRSPAGATEFMVYRLTGSSPAPETVVPGVEVDGPLDFLGYTLHADVVAPGSEIVLETYWRVRAVPGRPLSLMAHLIGPDGAGVAVGDGLGFPIEQWQPGDIIIQQHSLTIPDAAMLGQQYVIYTGGYWLDSMQRWTISGKEDQLFIRGILVSSQ